ncbi:hypothetical protein QR680_012092 [Steinernema hermaphroditum]|uniref:Uncharacterized protein n=1 Tax=Steinernema hermaphroditum TaxID=289476 RepID=A0AA39I0V7_9BILA|nr:hypothetical protein QR680_012092 [Steinernema hermaphroditum]
MEHTPFVFIESVIALFANLNACRKLSGYWGEAVLPERKTFKAVLDVYDGKILLKNTDRREMDCKEIRITARSYVMSSLEPPNKDDLIWALCNPVTTRLRQNLQLDNLWRTVGIYDGNDWRREDLLYPDEILDSISGNFKQIKIHIVRGYSTQIENLFVRILEHQLPNRIDICNADITSRTMSLILDHCFESKCSHVSITNVDNEVSQDQLTTFVEKWNSNPYTPIYLYAPYAGDGAIINTKLAELCGPEYQETSHGFEHESKRRSVNLYSKNFFFMAKE